MLTLSAQNCLQKFKMFWNHWFLLSMRTGKVSREPNLYSLLVQRLLLKVCVGEWGTSWEVSESERKSKIEVDGKKVGLDMKVTLIFLLCLLALNNSINFILVNTIDIPFLLLPLAPFVHKYVPKHSRSHLWEKH